MEFEHFQKSYSEKYNEFELERIAIMTVDGGLSDAEAEKEIEKMRREKWNG